MVLISTYIKKKNKKSSDYKKISWVAERSDYVSRISIIVVYPIKVEYDELKYVCSTNTAE